MHEAVGRTHRKSMGDDGFGLLRKDKSLEAGFIASFFLNFMEYLKLSSRFACLPAFRRPKSKDQHYIMAKSRQA